MTKPASKFIAVALLAGCLCLAPRAALAQPCHEGEKGWLSAAFPLEIWINDEISPATDLCSGCSKEDIREAVEVVMDDLYESSGTPLRFTFGGFTSDHPDCQPLGCSHGDTLAGAIHLAAQPSCTGTLGSVYGYNDLTRDPGTNYITAARIVLCDSNTDFGDITWEPFPRPNRPQSTASFTLTFAHELGHAVGLLHSDSATCDSTDMALMRGSAEPAAHHLFGWDIIELQALYGTRNNLGRAKLSLDGTTWYTSSWTAPASVDSALSRLVSCNGYTGTRLFVAFTDATSRLIQATRYGPSNWNESPGDPLFAQSYYHPGVACENSNEALIGWGGGYTASSGLQSVFYSTTQNAGDSWTFPVTVASGSDKTNNLGVNAAWDPVSGNYVVVWRNSIYDGNGDLTNLDEITTKVIASGAPIRRYETSAGSGEYWRARDSVSIACGPSFSQTAPYNCIVAWTDAEDWQPTLQYAHARVVDNGSGPELELFIVLNQGILAYGVPSIAYWTGGGAGSSYKWYMALHQGGATTFAFLRQNFLFSTWQQRASFSFQPKITSPAAGSRWTDKIYAFLTDT